MDVAEAVANAHAADMIDARDRLWARVRELEDMLDGLRLENAQLRHRLGIGEAP